MIAFTVLAFSVLSWQSADLSVDIESKSDPDSEEKKVVISVLNTAGSTLLFYENSAMTGKIEYLDDDVWVEYCDICYTLENTSAFSQKYGGVFAELQPGESWKVSVPEDKIADMKDGTYRIKMTYITEDKYKRYLNLEYSNHIENKNESESDISAESDSEVSTENTSDISAESVSDTGVDESSTTSEDVMTDESQDEKKESFLAEFESEVFVKTFEYIAPGKSKSKITTGVSGESTDIP